MRSPRRPARERRQARGRPRREPLAAIRWVADAGAVAPANRAALWPPAPTDPGSSSGAARDGDDGALRSERGVSTLSLDVGIGGGHRLHRLGQRLGLPALEPPLRAADLPR